jgi:hypothetical protein
MRRTLILVALAGLAVQAVGVVEAVPLVFFGTPEEHAAVDHGTGVMLAGTIVMLAAAAGLRSWLLAAGALLPAVLVLGSSVRARC